MKIEKYFAHTHQQILDAGRTRPFITRCSNPRGDKEFVLKYDIKVMGGYCGLVFELFGSYMASKFGVVTPPPAIIEISKDFADSVPDPASRKVLMDNTGYRFGCEYLPGMSSWGMEGRHNADFLEQAYKILLFDAFIQNPDRRKDKSNLGMADGEMVAFDHELAFAFCYSLDKRTNNCLSALPEIRQHFLFNLLSGKSDKIKPNIGNLDLTEKDLDGIITQLPDEWKNGCDKIDKVKTYILTEQSKLQELDTNLRRLLS